MTDTLGWDDAELLDAWLRECCSLLREPDAVLVASLEAEAHRRGFDCVSVVETLLAVGPNFDPDLHPRGHDGQFIEKFGIVKLLGTLKTGRLGRKTDLTGQRGEVVDIIPDRKRPGNPTIRVKVKDKKGRDALIDVTPDHVEQAPEKARLDAPAATPQAPAALDRDAIRGLSDEDLAKEIAARPYTDPVSQMAVQERNSREARGRAPEAPEAGFDRAKTALTELAASPAVQDAVELQRVQGNRPATVRAVEEAAQALEGADATNLGPRAEEFTRALSVLHGDMRSQSGAPASTIGIKTRGIEMTPDRLKIEALDRATQDARRLSLDARGARTPGAPQPPAASMDARRAALIANVNAKAAELSTTDAVERGNGLDEILSGLRFSIIDTDQVHDRISPPEGDSGRWTPERHAAHEAMWDDLLAQVESSGIPQERDAFALGGLPGAGKSSALQPGGAAERFGVVAWETNAAVPAGATHVSINPDIVKEMLIGRDMLPAGVSPDLKPMEQVTFIHEESSYLAKQWSKRLGDLGYNIVLDNTMDSSSGMLKRMTPLARQDYTFRGLFVDIPVEESLASTKARYERDALTPMGGRFVPSSVQGNRTSTTGTMSKNRDAMDDLVAKDWFTDWQVIDNTGVSEGNPKRTVTAQGTGAGSAVDYWKGDLTGKPGAASPVAPAIGGPNQSTITPQEASGLADEVMAGRAVQVDPPNLDDVIAHFADSPEPVDLTLVSGFAAMRDSGVPRAEMPQIPKAQLPAFQERLRTAGIGFTPGVMDPQKLRATQSELDGKQVSKMMRDAQAGQFDLVSRPVWVSSDDKVLDGHHRWAAASALSSNCGGCVEMPVIRVDMPMDDLLAFASSFNEDAGVQRLGFGEVSGTAPSAPAVAAAGTPVPVPDEQGNFDMATDAEDGVRVEDLAGLPHGDSSGTPAPARAAQPEAPESAA